MRLNLLVITTLVGLNLGGCATPVPRDVQFQLAPTGTLRVGINLSNTSLSAVDPAGGEPRGVAVDIARELGRRVGVPVKLLSYNSGGELGASIKSGQWDIAFFAIEPARAGQVDFSPPYVEIDTTYLVRKDAQFRNAEDVDRVDVTVAVVRGAGYESVLANLLKRAKLVRTSSFAESINQLNEQKIDAVAFLTPTLIAFADGKSNLRVVAGRFASVQQAIGIQKGREDASAYLKTFVYDIKQSGFLERSLTNNNIRGLTITK